MDHYHILVLNSSLDEMELGIGDILQSLQRGSLIRVDAQAPRTPEFAEQSVTRVRPDRLEQLYCGIASARQACTALVAAPCVDAALRFLDEHRGTTADFAIILCSATPDPLSQKKAAGTFRALLDMDVQPDQMGMVLAQAPAGTPVEQAFQDLIQLREERLPGLACSVVLPESQVFARARGHRIPLAGILNRQVDFEVALRQARQQGEDEGAIQALARKVLAQRALLSQTGRIVEAFAALPFDPTPPASQFAGVGPSRQPAGDERIVMERPETADASGQQ
jgi:hypothetical protein